MLKTVASPGMTAKQVELQCASHSKAIDFAVALMLLHVQPDSELEADTRHNHNHRLWS